MHHLAMLDSVTEIHTCFAGEVIALPHVLLSTIDPFVLTKLFPYIFYIACPKG